MREILKPIPVLNNRIFRQNKGRNIVAVTAIALTTLMFTTLFVLSRSMDKNLVEMMFRQTGYDAQVSFKSITPEQIAKIAGRPEVKEVGESVVVGLGKGDALTGRQVEVRFADESYAGHSFSLPETGGMPQQKDEIALDTIVLDRMGIPHELGLHWNGPRILRERKAGFPNLRSAVSGRETSPATPAWHGWTEPFWRKLRRGRKQAYRQMMRPGRKPP